MRWAIYTYVGLLCWSIGFESHLAHAQTYTIHGSISHRQGGPLAEANVFIKGSVLGTSSQQDGSFSFEFPVAGDTVLVVRHIAMEDVELRIKIAAQMDPIRVFMTGKNTQFEEVIIGADRSYTVLDGHRAITLRTMDIETTAGGEGDVIGALRTLSGVQHVGHETGLIVRGGSKDETNILINGLEVTHPYHSGVPDNAQKSRFSPHLFEGITFNTGGYSSLYGDALSSVLSLQTKHHPGQPSSVIALMLYGAQVGHRQVNPSRTTSFDVDLGYSNAGPYYRMIGHQTNWIKAPEGVTTNAGFIQNIGESGVLKWYGYGNYTNQEAFVPNLDEGPSEISTQHKNTNVVSLLNYTQNLNDYWQMYVGHGLNSNADDRKVSGTPSKLREKQHQFRTNFFGNIGGRMAMNLGSDLFIQHMETQQVGKNYLRFGAWTDIQIPIVQELNAKLGVRTAWNQAIKEALLWMPRVDLNYKWYKKSLTASAGWYAQQPESTLLLAPEEMNRETDLSFAHGKVRHYVLNYQHAFLGRLWRVEGYFKNYSDLVITQPSLQSGGSGYARGVDFFWRDPSSAEGLDYWLSYSWLDTKRKHLDYPVTAPPTFASPHTFHTVGKQFIESLGLFVGGSYTFSSGRPYRNPLNQVFHGDRTPPYHQINLNFALMRKWGNTFHTMVLTVDNLLGRTQIYDHRFSTDGSRHHTVTQPFKRKWGIGWFISIGQDRSGEIMDQLL